MKTLVIGDTHFHNSNRELRHEQLKTIRNLYNLDVNTVIFLGDVFDKRSPSPECLLDVKRFFDCVSKDTYILRGNHDSATKSDDGLTILSILERPWGGGLISIINSVTRVSYMALGHDAWFIPHYENEEIIKSALDSAPKGAMVYGHFGFDGSLNNAGDADFSICMDSFNNRTILGHIHTYDRKGDVTILGTPYSTCFQDMGQKYYGVVSEKGLEVFPFDEGPIHLVLTTRNLDTLTEYKDRYIIARILFDRDDVTFSVYDLKKKYPWVKEWDIKFQPTYDEEQLSGYKSSVELFQINDQIIDDYIEQAHTAWSKKELMSVLSDIKDED